VRTKIEFSRRDLVCARDFGIDLFELGRSNVMPSVLATHYLTPDAIRQKVHALAERSATQPRDVFDLQVLFARPDAPAKLDDDAAAWLDAAIENASKLTYDEYVALVVAYLEPAHAEVYGSREAWETMQLEVIERLEALR
jgi:hypothetical protein